MRPILRHQRIPQSIRSSTRSLLLAWISSAVPSINLLAQELPKLTDGLVPEKQFFSDQKKLAYLSKPYVSATPEGLGDGLEVGVLDLPGTDKAIEGLLADDKAGKYSNLDSILIWKDGKLLFEMYNRRGRVNGPHYAMSVTKTLTSVALGRAIQLGLISMDDLDKPIISFMPKIDVSKLQSGVDTITLRDALFMKSGLRFESKQVEQELGAKYSKQPYFQKLFENTAPVTPESKTYKYTGTDPSMIMMIIDIKAPGTAQEFIAQEIGDKFGAIYCWDDQPCGLPKCGAGGQYMATFPELNIVAVATAHNVKAIGLPLQATLDHLLPLFVE